MVDWEARWGFSAICATASIPQFGGKSGGKTDIVSVDVNCVVVTINYRHAPEHVFPAAHDDAIAGWRWATNPATKGLPKLDLGRVAIGGLSAYILPLPLLPRLCCC